MTCIRSSFKFPKFSFIQKLKIWNKKNTFWKIKSRIYFCVVKMKFLNKLKNRNIILKNSFEIQKIYFGKKMEKQNLET